MRITSNDLRSTARVLARHRGFTITAILSLALAIGLNTTMYSVLDTLVSPHVDVPKPEQLYFLAYFGDMRHKLDVRAKNELFRSALGQYAEFTGHWPGAWRALIETPTTYVRGTTALVAPDYFRIMGVRATRGRVLADDDAGASTPPAVITERVARDLFPHDANPLGQRIMIDGDAHVVVGVLGPSSDPGARQVAAWTLPAAGTNLNLLRLNIIRLHDGVTYAQIAPAVRGIADRIASIAGERPTDNRLFVNPLVGSGFHIRYLFNINGFYAALVFSVLAVLLVACANLANLQLARGIARSRELATRAALGASRRDIIAHVMLESALLAAIGVALGLVLTFWGMHVLRASIPESVGSFIVEPQTSWRLFAFATLAGVVCVLLVGLFPAIRVSRLDLNDLIKRGAGTGSTRRARRQYGLLIAAEIGFALVLTCGAALLVRAATQLNTEARAWDQSMLTEVRLQVGTSPEHAVSVGDLAADLVSRVRAIPEVADAAISVSQSDTASVVTATDPGGALRVVPSARWGYQVVSPSFLRTMGFEIAHGRDFREGEEGASVIVDPQFSRTVWPGADAVGRMIKLGSPDTPGRWYTVIGVRKPVGLESLGSGQPGIGSVYALPVPEDRIAGGRSVWREADGRQLFAQREIEMVVRARRNPQRTPIAVRAAFTGDPRVTPSFLGTFDEWSGARAERERHDFVGVLFSMFAVIALCLAALGVYGIVSHSVAERRREIGVRLALGSTAREILYVILREGNVFMLAGTALGLLMIRESASLVRGFLRYAEIDMYAVELYVPAALLLFSVAVAAALIPAWRATRIDPVEALRCE
jgi:putative ABC transport system permease protein